MTKKIEWVQDGPYTLAKCGEQVIGRYCEVEGVYELLIELPGEWPLDGGYSSEESAKADAQMEWDKWCEAAGLQGRSEHENIYQNENVHLLSILKFIEDAFIEIQGDYSDEVFRSGVIEMVRGAINEH